MYRTQRVISSNIRQLEARQLLALVSDESVVFWKLQLDMYTPCAEKLLLSLLSTESAQKTRLENTTNMTPWDM